MSELQALISSGNVQLPDASDCGSKLGTDPDPWATWMCRFPEGLKEDPNGEFAQLLDGANAEIAQKNLTGQHIGYFVPTRQVKTFHPRSPGMVAYRDAVIDAIHNVQSTTGTAAPGICKLDVFEVWTCQSVDENLIAAIRVNGTDGETLYSTPETPGQPVGQPINDKTPYKIQTDEMKQQLIVTGEHTGDYIQFNYGSLSGRYDTTDGNAKCEQKSNIGWNDQDHAAKCPKNSAVSSLFYS
jgi:hypothetical protein